MAKVKGPTFDQWLTIAGVGAAGLVLYELYINQGAIQAAIQTALNPNTAANNIYMQQGYTCPQGGYPTSTGICPNGQMAQAPGFGSAGYGQFCLGGGQPINGICPNGQMATSQPQLMNTNLPTGYGGLCSDGSTPNPVTGLCANGTFPSSVSPSLPFGGLPPPYSNILGGGTLFSPGGGDFGGFDGGGGWGGGGGGGDNWGGWNSPFNQQNQQTLNPLGPGLSYSCNDGSTPGSTGTCANGSQPTIISTPTTPTTTTPTTTGPTTITTPNPSGTMSCADGSTPSNGLCANGQAPSTALPAGTTTTPSGTVPSTATSTGTGTTTVTPTPAPAPAPAPVTATTPTATSTSTVTPTGAQPGAPGAGGAGGQPTLPATTGTMSGQQQGTTHRRFGMVGYQSEGAMIAAQAYGVRPRPQVATATGYSIVSPKHGNMPMTSHIFNRRFYNKSPIYMSNIH